MIYYVYTITHIETGRIYIGQRGTKGVPEHDLGDTYKSSSSNALFMLAQNNAPKDFIYSVAAEYKERCLAVAEETRLIRHYKNVSPDLVINGRTATIKLLSPVYVEGVTNEVVQALGAAIKSVRKQHKISESELAHHVGISRYTLQKIQKGELTTNIGMYIACCASLGIPLMQGHMTSKSVAGLLFSSIDFFNPYIKHEVDDDF